MNVTNFITNLFSSTAALLGFFFKSFSIMISAIFLIYSLVLLKQTHVMTRVLELKNKKTYIMISTVQVALAVILLVLAILLL